MTLPQVYIKKVIALGMRRIEFQLGCFGIWFCSHSLSWKIDYISIFIRIKKRIYQKGFELKKENENI